MKTLKKFLLVPAFAMLAFSPGLSNVVAQGSLTPPGAPAPTMKTLTQIEPRIPINATTTPGNASAFFRITNSGSYYLTGNILGETNKDGIVVTTTNVVIDLNGFSVIGVPGSKDGISLQRGPTVVRNGIVCGWGEFGLRDQGEGSLVENMQFTYNGATNNLSSGGAGVSARSVVRNCVFTRNNGSGLLTGDSCVVSRCSASRNGRAGIGTGQQSQVVNCVANVNKHAGFDIDDHSVASELVAEGNFWGGISCSTRVLIQNCVSSGNTGPGIIASTGSIIRNCQASSNTEAGIRTYGTGSRIEECHARNNGGFGILSDNGPGADIIIRNSSSGNTAGNYSPNSGATFAPIQTPATQSNPSANH